MMGGALAPRGRRYGTSLSPRTQPLDSPVSFPSSAAALPWRCPLCHGGLALSAEAARCDACARAYPSYDGIIDFRTGGESWIDDAPDLALARDLLAMRDAAAVQLAHHVFAVRPAWSAERAARYARIVAAAPSQLRADVGGWLRPVFSTSGTLVDLGCGAGGLLAAAASEGHTIIGLDVSVAWLVVARAFVREHGGTPLLAAAFGEALPLANDAVTGVISLDVIEHVAGRDAYVAEIGRVLAPGGRLALSTPNRFSLSAEPHVHVWGVGWLPRRWQRPYAEWRSGLSYRAIWLFSYPELVRTIERGGTLHCDIHAPQVPDAAIAAFTRRRALLARLYNRLVPTPLFQQVALWFGPFFRLVASKSSPR